MYGITNQAVNFKANCTKVEPKVFEKVTDAVKDLALPCAGTFAVMAGVNFCNKLKSRDDTQSLSEDDLYNIGESLLKQKCRLSRVSPGQVDLALKNLCRNSQGNTNLILERYNKIINSDKSLAYEVLIMRDFKNSDFLIDNLEEISSILTDKKMQVMFPLQYDLIEALDRKGLNILAKTSSPNEFKEEASKIIYNSCEHEIKFGEKLVTVDSAEVIAIISGLQSLSYLKNGNSSLFEKTVSQIADVSELNNGEQLYYKIVEGILKQRPDLIKITEELNMAIETSKMPILATMSKFFDEKAKTGELPPEITLHTVIPDENALMVPNITFSICKSKYK